ncbi:unnamed protein product [Darwinula stevensoni]|uniref:Uncharacterized protein n=1 Tax=Darwinula stevensoni TaxID=69355 RepID=A0A7R8ZZQ5_9CRUS|nr:unnamed protein product [Darwinula stevensoni]CAG0879273.1 unnamed protein product [Darwinula stevensoni]
MLEERKKGGASEVWRAQSVDALHPLPGQRNIKKARSHSYIASGAKVSSKYQHVESKVKKYIEEMKRTEPTKQKQDEYGQRGSAMANAPPKAARTEFLCHIHSKEDLGRGQWPDVFRWGIYPSGNMHNRVLEELRASCELGSAIRRHSVDLLESLRC